MKVMNRRASTTVRHLKPFESALSKALVGVSLFCALVLQGCSQPEIPGTYEVEIDIAGTSTKLAGTLILKAEFLEIPPLDAAERARFGDWLVSDSVDMNSCFILDPLSGNEDESNIVQIFETRMLGNQLSLPIEIVRMPPLRIKITKLNFFANTIGGDLVVHISDQEREGRISGVRKSPPSATRCAREFEEFREMLRTSEPI